MLFQDYKIKIAQAFHKVAWQRQEPHSWHAVHAWTGGHSTGACSPNHPKVLESKQGELDLPSHTTILGEDQPVGDTQNEVSVCFQLS
jgi:hypothetical protein